MTWFKVDDKLHSHSKTRKVLAEAPTALALWVVAGSWSSDNLTDGFVPDHQLPWLIPDGSEGMARQLVAARFWKRVKGGYLFHEWAADGDGTKRNPTRAEVETERKKKADAGRKGGLASAVTRKTTGGRDLSSTLESGLSTGGKVGETRSQPGATSGKTRSKTEAPASAPATQVVEPPTRPDPTYIGGALGDPLTTARTRPSSAPEPRCPEHLENPTDGPCGPCGDARRARTRWDLADAERRRNAPQCRHHRGQPADNCGLCRSEALAAEGTETA